MSDAEGERLGKGSAAELLSAWRAAERDRVAAEATLSVASMASVAAQEAARAAKETSDAARLSLEAAQKAEVAARRTSEAAALATRGAHADQGAAETALEETRHAEDTARRAYNDAQERGFPKT